MDRQAEVERIATAEQHITKQRLLIDNCGRCKSGDALDRASAAEISFALER